MASDGMRSRGVPRRLQLLVAMCVCTGVLFVWATVDDPSAAEQHRLRTHRTAQSPECPPGEGVVGRSHDGRPYCQWIATDVTEGPNEPLPFLHLYPWCSKRQFEQPCRIDGTDHVALPGWSDYPTTTSPPGRDRPSARPTTTTARRADGHPGCHGEDEAPAWVDGHATCAVIDE